MLQGCRRQDLLQSRSQTLLALLQGHTDSGSGMKNPMKYRRAAPEKNQHVTLRPQTFNHTTFKNQNKHTINSIN
jgi:hypothetical protein